MIFLNFENRYGIIGDTVYQILMCYFTAHEH